MARFLFFTLSLLLWRPYSHFRNPDISIILIIAVRPRSYYSDPLLLLTFLPTPSLLFHFRTQTPTHRAHPPPPQLTCARHLICLWTMNQAISSNIKQGFLPTTSRPPLSRSSGPSTQRQTSKGPHSTPPLSSNVLMHLSTGKLHPNFIQRLPFSLETSRSSKALYKESALCDSITL